MSKSKWERTGPVTFRTFAFSFLSTAFYGLLIANFPVYEAMLGEIAYRIAPSDLKILIGGCLVFAISGILEVCVPLEISLVGIFSHLIFCFVFIPLCAVYSIADGATPFLIASATALAAAYVIFGDVGKQTTNHCRKLDRMLMMPLLALAVAVLGWIAVRQGLSFDFLDFRSVYVLRQKADAGDSLSAGRWVAVSAYVASPFIAAYGYTYRKWRFVIFAGLNSLFLYNAFGMKLFILMPVISLAVCILMEKGATLAMPALLSAVMLTVYCLSSFGSLESWAIVDSVNQFIVRRFFYIQPYLAFAWYDTFVDKPIIALSNMIFVNKLIEYPFAESAVTIVALETFGKRFAPNTGLFGTSYANFGLLGIPLFVLATFVLLKAIDRSAWRARSAVLIYGAATPTVLFFEADFFSVVLSFGFWCVILLSLITRIARWYLEKQDVSSI